VNISDWKEIDVGYDLTPIGRVVSPLIDPASALNQGDEGAPEAWLVFDPAVLEALTRSPHRPNPVGLHQVEIVSIDGPRVRVRNLEAVDGTPVIDVKPVLSEDIGER
jgi:hypothetical protein